MGRPKKQPAEIIDAQINEEAIDADAQSLTVLAKQGKDALAKIGYDEPYNRERVIGEAKFYMSQSAEAMLESGRRLLVIKEMEPHGEFLDIVENRLGMSVRTAQVMMKATTKYLLNPALNTNAQALAHLGTTKLLELMTESDEDIEDLVVGGTLAGASLDDIDRMTTRELKAHLREAREEAKAKDQLLDTKNKQLDSAKTKTKRLKDVTPDVVLEEMRTEQTSYLNQVLGLVEGSFRWGIKTIMEHDREYGTNSTDFLAGCVAQIQRQIILTRDEFGLEDTVGEGKPDWMLETEAVLAKGKEE